MIKWWSGEVNENYLLLYVIRSRNSFLEYFGMWKIWRSTNEDRFLSQNGIDWGLFDSYMGYSKGDDTPKSFWSSRIIYFARTHVPSNVLMAFLIIPYKNNDSNKARTGSCRFTQKYLQNGQKAFQKTYLNVSS